MKEQEKQTNTREIIKTIVTLLALGGLGIAAVRDLGRLVEKERAMLDELCGKDRSGCVTHTVGAVGFAGNPVSITRYVTKTPAPQNK